MSGVRLDQRHGRAPSVALPRPDSPVHPAEVAGARPAAGQLEPWLVAQSVNALRHAGALRPFADGEFGTGAAAPGRGHVQAVNELTSSSGGPPDGA